MDPQKDYEIITQKTIFGERKIITERDNGQGCTTFFWGIILILLMLPAPYYIIIEKNNNKSSKDFFSWFYKIEFNTEILLFSFSFWIFFYFISEIIMHLYRNKTLSISSYFEFPKSYFTITLFISSISFFLLFILSTKTNTFLLYSIYASVTLVLSYIFIRIFKNNDSVIKKIVLSIVVFVFLIAPFIFNFYVAKHNFNNNSIQKEQSSSIFIYPIKTIKLKLEPKKESKTILNINQKDTLYFEGDSVTMKKRTWYKVKHKNLIGWVKKSDIRK
jgi:hypothetical protein